MRMKREKMWARYFFPTFSAMDIQERNTDGDGRDIRSDISYHIWYSNPYNIEMRQCSRVGTVIMRILACLQRRKQSNAIIFNDYTFSRPAPRRSASPLLSLALSKCKPLYFVRARAILGGDDIGRDLRYVTRRGKWRTVTVQYSSCAGRKTGKGSSIQESAGLMSR